MRDTDVVLQPGKYDQDAHSLRTGLLCEDESLAVQSEKEDADINTIVKRFGLTGELPQGMRAPALEDFVDIFDFQSAQNAVVAAREAFMELPAEVRSRFENDPQKFLVFCTETNEEGALANLEEMRKLGLAIPEKVPDPTPEPMMVRIMKDEEDGD